MVAIIGPATASADPATTAAGKIVNQQFADWTAVLAKPDSAKPIAFATGAWFGVTGGLGIADEVVPASAASELFGNFVLTKADVHDVRVGTSADGNAEWIFFTATISRTGESGPMAPVQIRGSELASKHGDKWLVDGGVLSVGRADADINAAAKAQTLATMQPITDATTGDKDVLAAFSDLMTKGFDDTSAARKDFITVGSGPGELTNGGKGIAPYFKKAWVGHAAINGPLLAITAPNKSTACVFATVNLPAGTKAAPYQIPFRLFVVFDKTAAGAWSPVHMHLAVP
jgi:ketosteroid isomerase-like protein